MRVTWYPRNLLIAVVLTISFGVAFAIASDVLRGVIAGVAVTVIALLVEGAMTFNWAGWRRRH
jgi:hypothetical protein